ncbi:MAG TPA: hypothetical protein VG095_02355 [Chthoniobacterales bacterium]|nr:hypothetical protein [Chthoniobacterales bacterium]
MSTAAPEIDALGDGLAIWHRYDSAMKAEVFSTALPSAAGIYLVDPIPLSQEELAMVSGGRNVVGIIVTNANHERAAPMFAQQLAAPIYASAGAQLATALAIEDGQSLTSDLAAIFIEGAGPGEIALHSRRSGGTLVVGDALINFGSHGFDYLPAKYATDPKLLRKSLRKLLSFSFERIFFAHGTPIVSRARERLIALLESEA